MAAGISNILVILGITCLASPNGVDVSSEVLQIDLPLAAAVSLASYPVSRSDQMVSRREGLSFVAVYVAYLRSLFFMRL